MTCTDTKVTQWFWAVLVAILIAIATSFGGTWGWFASAVAAAVAFGLTYGLNNAFKQYKQCRDQEDGRTQKCIDFEDNFNKLLGALRTTLGIAVVAFTTAAILGPLGGGYALDGQIAIFLSLFLLFALGYAADSYRKCRDQQANL